MEKQTLILLFLIPWTLLCIEPCSTHGTKEDIIDHEYHEAFLNAMDANTSESYILIDTLPVKTYNYKFDTISGRRQLGVIGTEIVHSIPEGVTIIPNRVIPGVNGAKSIRLHNFHVVDKQTLFMHNIAATKHLIGKSKTMEQRIQQIENVQHVHQDKLEELSKYLDQEASVQLVERRRMAEAEIENTKLEIQQLQVKTEEEKKALDYRRKTEEEIEQIRNQLAVKRLEAEDAVRREQNQELVRLQEESAVRIEMKRRETEEHLKAAQLEAEKVKALIEMNATIERTQLEVEGRIKQQRQNQDIEMQQLEARARADHQKMLDAIQKTFDNLGQGFLYIVMDSDRLYKTLAAVVTLAAGIYFSREAIRLVGHFIEQHLGRPSLVRETSRSTGLFGFIKSLFRRNYTEEELADVVLPGELSTRIYELARSTKNSRKHKAPFRHLLLYGPPGTGKTMVAKRLARCSGLDYAIMSGGDVGPLGSDAVTELHSIFRWAKASPRGVLLFIDEAEAFLGCRGKKGMSEAMRNALNALLYQTGEQSRKFMMVIATNRPEDLDTAVTDRIDETLHFELPGAKERESMLKMYYKRFILDAHADNSEFAKSNKPSWWKFNVKVNPFSKYTNEIRAPGLDEKQVLQAVTKTAGLSGREISKLMLYLQSVAYGQDDRTLTPAHFARAVAEKVKEHQRKKELRSVQKETEENCT